MGGVIFGCTFELGLLQDYRDCQQNSNNAKYRQREQSHHEDRHSFTSLLPSIFSPDCMKSL
jgi:hypothetical protein